MKKGIISIISAVTGGVIGASAIRKVTIKDVKNAKAQSDKYQALFLMMGQWVKLKQEGKQLSTYLEKKGCKKIAIYGMGCAGETLLNELKGTEIEVVYGIDKNADSICVDVDVVSVEDELMEVDAVVVTAVMSFDEIKIMLTEKMNCQIFSLEDILYEV